MQQILKKLCDHQSMERNSTHTNTQERKLQSGFTKQQTKGTKTHNMKGGNVTNKSKKKVDNVVHDSSNYWSDHTRYTDGHFLIGEHLIGVCSE
jgi:hypothetical protein